MVCLSFSALRRASLRSESSTFLLSPLLVLSVVSYATSDMCEVESKDSCEARVLSDKLRLRGLCVARECASSSSVMNSSSSDELSLLVTALFRSADDGG